MLRATEALLQLYETDLPPWHRYTLLDSHVGVIRRLGSREDAAALLPAFLADPEGRGALLGPLMEHGDLSTARALLERCFTGGVLDEKAPDDVLHALGYLGLPGIERMLFDHARSGGARGELGSGAACLGLLHYSCEGLEGEIEREVERCFGRNLFPEMIPALAAKTGNGALLEGIFELGATTASTDCNGGIILGVALFGEAGRERFRRILWDPHWEADSSATGSRWWLYAGTRCLGMGLAEVYAEMKARLPGRPSPRHEFRVMAALLETALAGPGTGLRFVPDGGESFAGLHRALFAWSTPERDDSLTGLAYELFADDGADRERLHDELHALERRLEDRVAEEVLLGEIDSLRAAASSPAVPPSAPGG